MKKILHVSKYYHPFKGGTEQIARECVCALKNKYEQKVICFNHGEGNKIDLVDKVEVIRCKSNGQISSQTISFSYGKMLKCVFNDFKPDIVIFHYPNPFVAHYLLKCLSAQIKFVIYWHLDIVKQKILKNFFIHQNKCLIQRADILIATSQPYIEGSLYLREVKDKCIVVPNCINVERLKFSEDIQNRVKEIRAQNEGKVICLAIGRHTKYKGFKYLIRASRKLDERFIIFIAGRGEETEKLKREAYGDNKVCFLGVVDDNELKAYLIAMDIFCFPSITKNEAFGLALAEGMYYGKPAVTFTIPGSGVNYVCINRENGIEVPNGDVTAYANALIELADNPELRKLLGENGRKRVIDNFLDTKFRCNILNIIESI